jgi:AraC family transcriptional regulator
MQHHTTVDTIRLVPYFEDKGAFLVAGLSYAGNNAHGEVSALWDAFIPRVAELLGRSEQFAAYGVIRSYKGARPDEFEYLAGVEVSSLRRSPAGMVGWRIPAQSYAALPAGNVAELGPVIDYFYREWIGRAPEYEASDGPSFEYYPVSYPADPTVIMYFPVHAQGAADRHR